MSDDLIKRLDAIGACAYETIECYEARKAIRALPSVDRPQGGWIKVKNDGVWSYAEAYAECDQCHKVIFNGWKMNFCPNCGARMKGAKYE